MFGSSDFAGVKTDVTALETESHDRGTVDVRQAARHAAAKRINDTLIQEEAPQHDSEAGAENIRPQVVGVAERLIHMTQHVLDHEASDTRSGVDCGEDKERLEQDREVIPECFHRLAAHRLREDLRHADGERWGAAGSRQD